MTRAGRRLTPLLLVAATILGTAAATPLPGQLIHGRLIDATSKAPVATASLALLDREGTSIAVMATDSVGYFRFSPAAGGAYRLSAEKIGYPRTVSTGLRLAVGDTVEVEFSISAQAVLLDPVVVTARRRRRSPMIEDFYRRAERAAFGSFVTRAEIERSHAIRTTDLLHGMAGVRLVPLNMGGGAAVLMRGSCLPLVIVDGIVVRNVRSIDELVQPIDLEGLEVYRSATEVPVEYGGLRGGCGAVMAWTRRDR